MPSGDARETIADGCVFLGFFFASPKTIKKCIFFRQNPESALVSEKAKQKQKKKGARTLGLSQRIRLPSSVNVNGKRLWTSSSSGPGGRIRYFLALLSHCVTFPLQLKYSPQCFRFHNVTGCRQKLNNLFFSLPPFTS